jgi:CheY-like chemotaxis protein
MKKIIVIDDEQTTIELLRVFLEKNNYDIVTATDGAEGFVLLKKEKPDLAILDIHMPNVDGYQLIRDIKADEDLKNIPVIVITADESLEERFQNIGIRHYCRKPIKIEPFIKLVDNVLHDKRF